MPDPFLSIIVPCRNAATTLEACLSSVSAQSETSWELIVVDGLSTDGSNRIFDDFKDTIGVLISEKDKGVYDAMNKGLRRAQGTWLLFLGADDRLSQTTVLANAFATLRSSHAGIVAGTSIYSDGRHWTARPEANPRFRNFLHHQACFYHRTVFANTEYDTSLCMQADYDLNLQSLSSGVELQYIDLIISICGAGGLSDAGNWQNYKEEIAVRHRYYSSHSCWLYDFTSVLRYFLKKCRAQARKRPE